MAAEFCPNCYHPLTESVDKNDTGRICSVCDWFGDATETCKKPPPPSDMELAMKQLLVMYREVCRLELTAEDIAGGNPEFYPMMQQVKQRTQDARDSILHLFRTIQNRGQNE